MIAWKWEMFRGEKTMNATYTYCKGGVTGKVYRF